MPVITAEHKADIVRRVDRVRRWTRNGDMLAICDTLERLLAAVGSTKTASVGSTSKRVGSTAALPYCPECAARKETKRLAMARYRSRKSRKSDPAKPAGIAAH